jgi:hypothetical protein
VIASVMRLLGWALDRFLWRTMALSKAAYAQICTDC